MATRALNSALCCFLFTPTSLASLDRSALAYPPVQKTGAAANPTMYQDSLQNLKALLTKFIGWTTAPLKAKLKILEESKASASNPDSVFLPFVVSTSKLGPNKPLNPDEQLKKLCYILGGISPDAVIEIGGSERSIKDHNDRGAAITVKDVGDVRVSKQAGASRLIDRAARAKAHWKEVSGKAMDWLSRKEADKKLRQKTMAALKRLADRAKPSGKATESKTISMAYGNGFPLLPLSNLFGQIQAAPKPDFHGGKPGFPSISSPRIIVRGKLGKLLQSVSSLIKALMSALCRRIETAQQAPGTFRLKPTRTRGRRFNLRNDYHACL